MDPALVTILVGVFVTAGLATIAYFFRSWATEMGHKIDRLETTVANQSVIIAQLQVLAGWPYRFTVGNGVSPTHESAE